MQEQTQDPLDTLLESEVSDEASEAPGAEVVTKTDDADEGQPRSDDGRFASPEDKAPEGQAELAAEGETPEGEADAGAAEVAEPTPYTYRADARTYEITGATVGPDGVLSIPQESVSHLTQLLASGRSWADARPRELASYQQQVTQAQAEVEASNQTRAALLEQFETVVKMTPEQRLDWAEGFVGEWPAIRAQAEQAGVEAGRQADKTRLEQFERQDRERELEPQLRQGLEEHMVRAQAEDPLFRDMTQEDLVVVYDKLLNGWQSNGLLRTAENMPWNGEQNPQIDLTLMRREMEYVASLRRRTTTAQQATTEAKKTNAAELKDGKAPPAVTTKTGSPAEEQPVKRFKLPKGVDPNSEEATELVDAWAEGREI